MKKIAEYAYLDRTQRSWKLWIGNPFCITCETIPLKETTEEQLINFAKKSMAREKKRFAKEFPDVKWETFNH
jgi:hypothetical protein